MPINATQSYAFPSAAEVSLAIVGDESRFPVGRIFCVGRNYDEYAREMRHVGEREAPFFLHEAR